MADKKETVLEQLYKLGTMNTANVLTNIMLNIARESEEEYGCLDRAFVTEKLYRFLKAPADDYYFCSVQEANTPDDDKKELVPDNTYAAAGMEAEIYELEDYIETFISDPDAITQQNVTDIKACLKRMQNIMKYIKAKTEGV